MRKILLGIIMFFTFSGAAFSQGCNPQWIDSGFVYPFTNYLPCIVQGVAYNNSFQINMPNMFHGILELDTMFIDSITGFPTGITWTSNPSPLVLPGDSSGCVTMTGISTVDTATYYLTFFCHAVVTSQSSVGTVQLSENQLLAIGDAPIPVFSVNVIAVGDSCYPIDTIADTITAIPDITNASSITVYPNPIKTGNWLVTVSGDMIGSQAEVYDTQGRILFSTTIRRRNFAISPNNFASGIYVLRFHSPNYSVTKKLIKL